MELKNKKIMQAVSAYCKLNNIEDIDGFIEKCFQSGFNIEKYGLLGKPLNEDEKDLKISVVEEKQLIKEVIVEKMVEVPVEVIKEVEKIIEVIKEVPVEKIVTKIEYISDKESENELGEKIAKLEYEMSKKDEELEEFRRNLDISKQNDKTKLLQDTLQKLRQELHEKNQKIDKLEKINQELQSNTKPMKGFFMRGSNINDTL